MTEPNPHLEKLIIVLEIIEGSLITLLQGYSLFYTFRWKINSPCLLYLHSEYAS